VRRPRRAERTVSRTLRLPVWGEGGASFAVKSAAKAAHSKKRRSLDIVTPFLGKYLPAPKNARGSEAIRDSHASPEPVSEQGINLHQPRPRRASGIITLFECGFLPGEIVTKERNARSQIPRMPSARSYTRSGL
jgi:hypothetical protein